jgi:hypothetical protein
MRVFSTLVPGSNENNRSMRAELVKPRLVKNLINSHKNLKKSKVDEG